VSAGYLAQQIVNGLILGSMYALVAIGFSMIYGIVRLINFAHGDIVMIGAFVTLGLMQLSGVPFPLIVLAVFLAGALVGMLIEKGAFRPMRGAPQVTGFIASLAVSIMMQNLGVLLLTAQPRNFTFPDYLQTLIHTGPVSFRVIDLVIMLTTWVLMWGLLLLVNHTRLGIAMRATAENLDVARLMGININRTILASFAIGSGLAGIAGLMWGGKFGQIDPLLGFVPGLKAFVAAVIGGVGSIPGAILGGYVLGLAEVLFVGLLPPIFSAFRDAFVFSTLILILLVLPNGLLGKKTEDRA
jgi:branched-chain amino acid transport system permease protein